MAIPVGLVVWAIAAFQGHEELAKDVFMLLVILGPFGLFLRCYAYYINRVFGNETGVEDQAEEES